ncbi:lantibiotic dehydratase [Streptomyces chryseus]
MEHSGTYESSGFFVLRSPLLPFPQFTDGTAVDGGARGIWARDAGVREAVWVASPSLSAALEQPAGSGGERTRNALAAYVARAGTRSTPFGLFAGVTPGTLGETTRVQFAPRTAYLRRTRLDNDYLCRLITALQADPVVRGAVGWTLNSSLYRAGDRLHYMETRLTDGARSHHLVAVAESAHLTAVLEMARAGGRRAELAAMLCTGGVTQQMAERFIDQLINAQILVSELQLQVTGREPLAALIERLARYKETVQVADRLAKVQRALAELDAAGVGVAPGAYKSIQTLLGALPTQVNPARLFQVDLVKPAVHAELGPQVVAEVHKAIEVLQRLMLPTPQDPLTRFRERFTQRYGDAEVPLAAALDEEIGIGFTESGGPASESPLLGNLRFPVRESAALTLSGRDQLLVAKVQQALARGQQEIRLDEDDIAVMEVAGRPAPPDAVEARVTVLASSATAVDQGEFRLLVRGLGGAPGVSTLGRFCHADEALHHAVQEHLRREERRHPEAAFAEVVHLPEGRIGNVVCRPVLRQFEIPYLGHSGAPDDAQIPMTDLTVAVRGDRIVLRSHRLGREVIPVLTTAHNVNQKTVGVYRFLGALRHQGTHGAIGWEWGGVTGAPFLPRVTYGRLILARARWTLRGQELATLRQHRATGVLPRLVALVDHDKELVCDLDDDTSRSALEWQLRGRSEATLVEVLPRPDEVWIEGPEGRYAHELIIPFVRSNPDNHRPGSVAVPRPQARRRFPPGSQWLYAKLYCGPATADRVLAQVVRPVVDRAIKSGAADSWFFIRYADPDWHVRLRLHGDPQALTSHVLPHLNQACAPLLTDGPMWRLQLDTYERELERYGGDTGIEPSEELFRHDSDTALAIVETLRGDVGTDARWRLTLVGIDLLLDDLGLDLPAKHAWAKGQRDAFATEFRVDGDFTGQLSQRYRTERRALEVLLNNPGPDHWLAPGLALFHARSKGIRQTRDKLLERGLPVEELAASYAHMHANRLLRSAHRAQELVIYDLLHRLYTAQLHRISNECPASRGKSTTE